MKRRISFQFAFVIILAILSFVIGTSLIVQNNLNKITELNLNQYLNMVSTDVDKGLSPAEIVVKYQDSNDFLRITFMNSSGVVLVDSLATNLDNHLSRPEFQNLGTAYIRESDTLNKKMMYLATQINDDLFLRVAIPINSILPFLNDFIGLSLVIGAVIAGLSVLLIYTLTKNTLVPLKNLKDTLNEVYRGEYKEVLPLDKFVEMNGIINEINDISRLISSNIVSLNEEKLKSDFLLNHMNQGICVLDFEGKVVLVNQFLRTLFHYSDEINFHKDYLYLFREKAVQDAIKKAYHSNVNTTTLIEINNEYFSVFVAFLEKNWLQQPSVVLLFTDVTDVKNIETLKRDFFINASHELKSPLTSIMGASELISSGMVKDLDTIQDLASRILDESTRMNHLVMDMLNLSKYENQMISNTDEFIELDQVVLEVKNMVVPSMEKKNMIWKESLPKVVIRATHEHMVQLIRNLVENSIQYGNDGGMVSVSLSQQDESIQIVVEDNGIGIPKADQSRVFERFYRVDKARSKKTGGTGLGLSIVKHIVLIYQGQIELESQEGKGTKITIVFPK